MRRYIVLLIIAACSGLITLQACGNISVETEDEYSHIQKEPETVNEGEAQQFDFKDFNQIEASGASSIVLTQSDDYTVRIKGDERAKEHLTIRQSGARLIIEEESDWLERLDKRKYEIHISLPQLGAYELSGANTTKCTNTFKQDIPLLLDLSGAGSINLDIEAPSLIVDAGGATSLVLRGKVEKFEVDMAGAGSVDALNLESNTAKISSSGAGSVKVWANKQLNIDASGVGAVKYKGNAEVLKTVSGMASVKRID